MQCSEIMLGRRYLVTIGITTFKVLFKSRRSIARVHIGIIKFSIGKIGFKKIQS
jgi:hypothetical protein